MSDLIAHPLTGGGAYTADMYRKVVNASITPSDGTPFGALQGIRAGAPSPLVETDGLKAIIHPHAGWICPWTGVGAYSYAILDDTEIDFESSSQNYKLALVLDDPSQGHGSTPQLTARIYPAATSDTTIPGIVIATIINGTANDTAPILLPQALLMARDKTQLDTIDAVDGQQAVTLSDNAHYVRNGGAWDSGKMKASVILNIFQELDPLNVRRNGNMLQVGGSVKMVKGWNPAANDHVLQIPNGIRFDGYQQNFTLCTNNRILTLKALDNTNYIMFSSSGGVGDWAVGTQLYAQSTWSIKD